ncbi:TPA: hypothetical protein N2A64_005171 [Pseudomonas aeruginosa]|nr:hypothetical protein [Pseudomonas aeruginosa]HCL3370855.1 hypothetical protein [Pseudomonas aeruginosa]HCT4780897.1 hypothetical protein [Pseudomonas aeruginosa]
MSKTAQRRRAMYDQGYDHGRTGHHFYWLRHPCLDVYSRGYEAGRRDRLAARRPAKAAGPALFLAVAMVFGCILVAGLRGIA